MQGKHSVQQPDGRPDIPEPIVSQLGEAGLKSVSLESVSVNFIVDSPCAGAVRGRRSCEENKMIIREDEAVELTTPYGPMRTVVLRPVAPGKYPGVVFYSEIFQITGPIRRTAAMLRGTDTSSPFRRSITSSSRRGRCLPTTRPAPTAECAQDDQGTRQLRRRRTGGARSSEVPSGLHWPARRNGHLHRWSPCLSRGDESRCSRGACFYATDIHKGSLAKGITRRYSRAGQRHQGRIADDLRPQTRMSRSKAG